MAYTDAFLLSYHIDGNFIGPEKYASGLGIMTVYIVQW